MNFIKRFLFGIAIGSGAILPGISSGVICVIFGVYDKLVHSILNFFSDIKKNFIYLFPILCGTGIGIILFGNLLKKLFYYFPETTSFAFIGLILGCIPFLFKKANEKNGFRLSYLLYLILSLAITLLLIKIENSTFYSINSFSPTYFYLIICGFLMSIGVVVPGVSSTAILMLTGIYNTYLSAVSTLNFQILIPLGTGLFIGCIIFLKIIDILLSKYFSQTYYAIIRFYNWFMFYFVPWY